MFAGNRLAKGARMGSARFGLSSAGGPIVAVLIDIATEQSDCWVNWHDLRLEPTAVVRSDRSV